MRGSPAAVDGNLVQSRADARYSAKSASILPPMFKPTPTAEAHAVILNVLAVILQTSLAFFSQPGNMENVCVLLNSMTR